jgi:hypothetical protein
MSTLRAILEIQGCLDTAVVTTQDPRVMQIADAFLPGTSANPQWYPEIEAFMLPRGADGESEPPTRADPVEAMEEFQKDWRERGLRPNAVEASRFIYGLGAVIHLTQTVSTDMLPFRGLFDDDAEQRELLSTVFALTGGQDPSDDAYRLYADQFDQIRDLFVDQFNGWGDWYVVAPQLVQLGVLTRYAASVPLCVASVVTVDGIESLVVDTELSSYDVSLNDLKAVMDPRNWSKDCPSFFCDMEYRGLRTDNWRRVLETVGYCSYPTWISPRLVTMLKFYKSTVNDPDRHEARLDYDLNDPVPDPASDGKITVDRGFINMWTAPKRDPAQPPVFVRTRKVCHIDGLRPYTMKRFVCAYYGSAMAVMLFGSALNYGAGDTDYVPWEDPSNEVPGDGNPQGQGGQQGGKGKQKPPPDNSVVSTAISMVAKCVQDLTVKQFDLADKWMSGQLTVDDLKQYSAEVGARIASDPWKFIEAISQQKRGGK